MFNNVAVAYRSDPEPARALDRAFDLVKALGVTLIVLTITEPRTPYTAFSVAVARSARRRLEQGRSVFYEEVQSHVTSQGRTRGVEVTACLSVCRPPVESGRTLYEAQFLQRSHDGAHGLRTHPFHSRQAWNSGRSIPFQPK